MIVRIARAAVLAGALAGIFAWGLQMAKTLPLILQAETYEEKDAGHAQSHAPGQAAGHAHAQAVSDKEWEPEDGFERNAYTLLATLIASVGFAFMLTGAMALSGREVDARTGLIWGLAGFAAAYAAPALGLPPEVPGMPAGDVLPRQAWWFATAAATAGGIALIAFARGWAWKALALALIVAPHVIGPPGHAAEESAVPPQLAAEFAVASLVTVGLFWAALGSLAGHFLGRTARA